MMQLTEQQLLELMRSAWWAGHGTSGYHPNPNGAAGMDCRELLKDFKESEAK